VRHSHYSPPPWALTLPSIIQVSHAGAHPPLSSPRDIHYAARFPRCTRAHDRSRPPALSSSSMPAPGSTPARSLRMRIANHGGVYAMGWRWIRARRCVAPVPSPSCLPYIHALGRPSLTQPSHTAPAQHRRSLKVKSNAQALRSGPCPCPQTQVQLHDCNYAALHPGTLRMHDIPPVNPIRPAQGDGSSSTHIPQGVLEIRRICVVNPHSGHTPALCSRFKLDCTTMRAHWRPMSVPARCILFPPTPSLRFLPPSSFAALSWCHTPSHHPFLPCRVATSEADVDHGGARTSALALYQSGGGPTRGLVLQSATSCCTCPSLVSTPDGLRASPALPTCSIVRRAPRPPPAYFLAPLSYTMLSASKSGE
jgi:hypothetical protein